MSSFRVVYDTCTLVPAPLRDLLLRVAEDGLVRASFGEGILDELERVLLRDFDVPAEAATRLRAAIERTFDDSVVGVLQYADLVGVTALPDKDDEHVVAAARCVGAKVIVTQNLKDFPSACLEPLGIEAMHPDEFLLDLVDLYPIRIDRIVREQAAALKNPPMTYDEVLDALERSVPETVAQLREL